jgi:hypothetical protein
MSGINIALAAIGWVFFCVTLLSLYGLLAVGLGWAEGADGVPRNTISRRNLDYRRAP